jgi:hypothetical protein
MTTDKIIPSVSFTTAQTGASKKANEYGMRVMQERAYRFVDEPFTGFQTLAGTRFGRHFASLP